MYWKEASDEKSFNVSDEIIDLSFQIECKSLPIDHAWDLSQQITQLSPWIKDTPGFGIHLIHGAESGNGWNRPEEGSDALIHLSRRARFRLRLPKSLLVQAKALSGETITMAEHSIRLGKITEVLFVPQQTVFARYVLSKPEDNEATFLDQCAEYLTQIDIPIRKMMSGRKHHFQTPNGTLHTRSLMLADVEKDESIRLQQLGIGEGRLLGMGLFLPHKGITAVKDLGDNIAPGARAFS